MNCFFRDDALSDLIGFTYATWHGDDAAANLVNELAQLAQRYAASGNHAVLIALDGENAWEHYPFNGYYFLRALYAQLADHPRLELTTLSECLARGMQPAPLPRRVRRQLGARHARHLDRGSGQEPRVGSAVRGEGGLRPRHAGHDRSRRSARAAGRQLALCESSDWFWWFGDYNPADAVSQFDRLYRRQLVTLYRRLNLAPPADLALPICGRLGSARARRRHAPRQRLSAGTRVTARLPVFDRRRAGVLLPLSALDARRSGAAAAPSSTGSRSAGFSVWQILPVGPTGADGSPYWVRSDCAGNPALLDPAELPAAHAPLDAQFLAASAVWLPDYVLFEALTRAHGGAPFWRWPRAAARSRRQRRSRRRA